jgi:hypothetical protein
MNTILFRITVNLTVKGIYVTIIAIKSERILIPDTTNIPTKYYVYILKLHFHCLSSIIKVQTSKMRLLFELGKIH